VYAVPVAKDAKGDIIYLLVEAPELVIKYLDPVLGEVDAIEYIIVPALAPHKVEVEEDAGAPTACVSIPPSTLGKLPIT
jgi:hypothetical protein